MLKNIFKNIKIFSKIIFDFQKQNLKKKIETIFKFSYKKFEFEKSIIRKHKKNIFFIFNLFK